MSYDIYGNPLRRGHCGVHPHIHEEYPCSVCLADAQRRKNPRPAVDCDPLLEIAELKIQRDELLAVLEKLSGDVEALVKESCGVYGLHQNSNPAPWGELIAKLKDGAA